MNKRVQEKIDAGVYYLDNMDIGKENNQYKNKGFKYLTQEHLHAAEVDNAIAESESRLANGEKPIEAHEALAMLKRKYV